MIPCSGCSRFIRVDAARCPFCDVARQQMPSPLRPVVASVLLGLTLAACGGDSTGDEGASASVSASASATETNGATMDGPGMTSMNGMTTMATGPDTTTGPAESEEAVAAYGGPDVDTLPPDEDTAADDGTTGTDTGTSSTGGSTSTG